MRLLKRNTTPFVYRPFLGQREILENDRHTGQYEPTYGEDVPYTGTMGEPNGYSQNTFYGIETNYTHVLLLDKPDADIRETGLIEWKGDVYEIVAVRPSLNVLSVALRKQTTSGMEPFTAGDGW